MILKKKAEKILETHHTPKMPNYQNLIKTKPISGTVNKQINIYKNGKFLETHRKPKMAND
jgi:hypothetical protein